MRDIIIIEESCWYNDETGESGRTVREITLACLRDQLKEEHEFKDTELNTQEQILEAAAEYGTWFEFPVYYYTQAEGEKRRRERERAEIEPYVAQVAQSAGVDARDTIGVLDALTRELERFEDYRYGMREDGLCIGWGVTPDQWFEERNASYGDSAKAERAIDFIAEVAPLAYAEWVERPDADD